MLEQSWNCFQNRVSADRSPVKEHLRVPSRVSFWHFGWSRSRIRPEAATWRVEGGGVMVKGGGWRVEQQLYRNVQRFLCGHVFKTHRLCVSLNSRLESNREEKKVVGR